MGNNAFVKAMNLDRARRNPFEQSSERQGALNQAEEGRGGDKTKNGASARGERCWIQLWCLEKRRSKTGKIATQLSNGARGGFAKCQLVNLRSDYEGIKFVWAGFLN